MKRSTAGILAIITTIFAALPIWLVAVWLIFALSGWRELSIRVNENAENMQTIEQFVKKGVPWSSVYAFTKDDKTFIYWVEPHPPLYLFTSGSPCYIFDEAGKLVDHTTDQGDDWYFKQNWPWYGNLPDELESPQAAVEKLTRLAQERESGQLSEM